MTAAPAVLRTTVASSWSWMRLDLVVRLVPLTIVPVVFSWLTGTPLRDLGLMITHPLRDLLVAIPVGVAAFVVAAAFNVYLSRRSGRWFVPTEPDLLVQSAYYLVLNAPIEEWFFRGFLQGSLARWWNAPLLAVLAATAVFGAYHFLDRWGWRPVVGATAAGLTLGLVYLWQSSPASLFAPVLVHAAITCGFLSLGPYLVYRWRLFGRG
ncbi:MAG TPA: CPBP family intramembrane glutamic endopeptidase [Candidatus Dormibacteraeota bacterium]|nr:CPBP family intramembrane glutamic endopeptidase [Candidatus Dormibacteraeota bacterium]